MHTYIGLYIYQYKYIFINICVEVNKGWQGQATIGVSFFLISQKNMPELSVCQDGFDILNSRGKILKHYKFLLLF